MEMILWLALGITAGIGVVLAAIPVAAAWRLHRKTTEKLETARRGVSGADYRYDPKQFRRR